MRRTYDVTSYIGNLPRRHAVARNERIIKMLLLRLLNVANTDDAKCLRPALNALRCTSRCGTGHRGIHRDIKLNRQLGGALYSLEAAERGDYGIIKRINMALPKTTSARQS